MKCLRFNQKLLTHVLLLLFLLRCPERILYPCVKIVFFNSLTSTFLVSSLIAGYIPTWYRCQSISLGELTDHGSASLDPMLARLLLMDGPQSNDALLVSSLDIGGLAIRLQVNFVKV